MAKTVPLSNLPNLRSKIVIITITNHIIMTVTMIIAIVMITIVVIITISVTLYINITYIYIHSIH